MNIELIAQVFGKLYQAICAKWGAAFALAVPVVAVTVTANGAKKQIALIPHVAKSSGNLGYSATESITVPTGIGGTGKAESVYSRALILQAGGVNAGGVADSRKDRAELFNAEVAEAWALAVSEVERESLTATLASQTAAALAAAGVSAEVIATATGLSAEAAEAAVKTRGPKVKAQANP